MYRSFTRLVSRVAAPICAAATIQAVSVQVLFAAPIPALTSINPSSAMATGAGFAIMVNGSNFQGTCKVLWNGSPISSNLVSSSQLKGFVSSAMIAASGRASVTVENSAGTRSNAETFTVSASPKIGAISPTSTTAGANAFTLTVTGTNFYSDTQITWHGQPITTKHVSATQLTATVTAPIVATAGSTQVGIVEPGGISGGSLTFAITARAAVFNVSPASVLAGSPGFALTVNGANFTTGSNVTWNGSPLTTHYISPSQLQAAITAAAVSSAGTVNIGTVAPDASVGTSASFTVRPAPSITGLSPGSATATSNGFSMAVNGAYFVAGYSVTWNGQPISTTFVSSGQLQGYVTKTMLAGAGNATVQVVTPTSVASNTASFTINGDAVLTSISPMSALQGSASVNLSVVGTGFTSAWTVLWNGAALATSYVSPTALTAVIPASDMVAAGIYKVTVRSPDGVVTQPLSFNVLVQSSGASLWSQKLVWAHCLPDQVYSQSVAQCLGLYTNMYPLDLQPMDPKDSPAFDIQLAQADEIDGFGFDIFTDGTCADSYLSAADANGHFLIAACLDLTILYRAGDTYQQMEDAVVQAVIDYSKDAATHPSAAREGNSLVVFTYGLGMPLANWQDAVNRIAAAGVSISWVADVHQAYDAAITFPQSQVQAFENIFAAGYIWTGRFGPFLDDTVAMYHADGRNFASSLDAGADRPGSGTYYNAKGTERMREVWTDPATSQCNWMSLTTWNDYQEMSSVNQSSDWNSTRWDIDLWYNAAFKGNPAPFTSSRLYVTTPKAVALDQDTNAEALVINPTSGPVTAYIQLYDGSGAADGALSSATIQPGGVGSADIPVTFSSAPAGNFLRAHAWSVDANGNIISSVVSAPILVYTTVSSSNLRIDYYSIPAANSLAGTVSLSLTASAAAGQMTATITPPTGTNVLFSDLICDSTVIQNTFDHSPAPASVQTVSGTFYVARIIDQNKMVGYSDPVYVGP
jgi:hypothetical protein